MELTVVDHVDVKGYGLIVVSLAPFVGDVVEHLRPIRIRAHYLDLCAGRVAYDGLFVDKSQDLGGG